MNCTCGFSNVAGAAFCGECGRPLSSSRAATADQPRNAGPPAAGSERRPSGLTRRSVVTIATLLALASSAYWWMSAPPSRYEPDNGGLFPVLVDGKYGFMDRSGAIGIQPQFEAVSDFSEGHAAVRVGSRFGYINSDGQLVINPQFDSAGPFRHGRAVVSLADKFGVIDDSGEYVSGPTLTWVSSFDGGFATVVTADGIKGVMDRSGNLVATGTFDSLSVFSEGLVRAGEPETGRVGYLDTRGEWHIDPQFNGAKSFSGGLAPVDLGGRTGYINRKGQFVVNPQYEDGEEFSEGYAAFKAEGKWGYLNAKGHVSIEPTFESAGPFKEGFAPVSTREGWGLIDTTGAFAVSPRFDLAEPIFGGLARVSIGARKVYIDSKGTYVGDTFDGRTLRPPTTTREVWEGKVVGPTWTSLEKFLLVRNGNQIGGFYWREAIQPSEVVPPAEVVGELGEDDTIRLRSEHGTLWKGRFYAPILIAGAKPNGPDGESPEFPFRLTLTRNATAADIPPPLPPTPTSWSIFLADFTEAIHNYDRSSLARMIGRSFGLQNSMPSNSPAGLLQQLNWQEVRKVLADGESREEASPLGRRQVFLTDRNPCSWCEYQVMLVFEQDGASQWRWMGVSYPGD